MLESYSKCHRVRIVWSGPYSQCQVCWVSGAWQELVETESRGPGLGRRSPEAPAGAQDRELKTLEFWTESKDGHWELWGRRWDKTGNQTQARTLGGPWVLELGMGQSESTLSEPQVQKLFCFPVWCWGSKHSCKDIRKHQQRVWGYTVDLILAAKASLAFVLLNFISNAYCSKSTSVWISGLYISIYSCLQTGCFFAELPSCITWPNEASCNQHTDFVL